MEALSEEFFGLECNGRYTVFPGEGRTTVLIMVSVDDTVWDGIFKGSIDRWDEALAFLRSLRRAN
jgi:hypothetical protein